MNLSEIPIITDNLVKDMNTLAQFLARRDVVELAPNTLLEDVDAIVLLGSSVLATIEVAVAAFNNGLSDRIVISGGIGHSTPELWNKIRSHPEYMQIPVDERAEADIIRDLIIEFHQVPESALIIENQSTNCGLNAWETRRVLSDLGISNGKFLLIQDPTMQLRSHLSFQRAWRGDEDTSFVSFAPFIPIVQLSDQEGFQVEPEAWSQDRFMSLLLGEIPRLANTPTGYGPEGRDFIEHVDIPREVTEAFDRVRDAFGDRERKLS